ncbi:MAG TPA: alcohol dehydrogenase catalytic domain-containing protein [Solirubrobacteraceae bacterium]|nr:alcohol dehydrogenase catalytic domain-containing protein [Solirubrobacteraceae bacterium]
MTNRAALLTAPGTVELVDRAQPAAPGPGEVLVAPAAVGICGSDIHYLLGDDPRYRFPRVLGHELIATVRAAGAGVGVAVGQQVAVWPLQACGDCGACEADRPNACPNFSLIGVHCDGGLQDALLVPETQCFPIEGEPALMTLAEPLSVAIHAVARGEVGDQAVVVLGAGPIGLLIGFVATGIGARVLIVDRLESRLKLARRLGMETVSADSSTVTRARGWAGGDGPPVVFDATASPAAVDDALSLVRSAGRLVLVGLPGERAQMGFGVVTHKELDVLGSSCCTAAEFAEAVDLVQRRGEDLRPLITGEVPLVDAGEALRRVAERPAESVKVVIRVGDEA